MLDLLGVALWWRWETKDLVIVVFLQRERERER